MNRFRNLLAFAVRFGWRQTAIVSGLWIARQLVNFRSALVFELDVTQIPAIPGCDSVAWSYQPNSVIDAMSASTPSNKGRDRQFFIGTINGVECYSSVVSTVGFVVPERGRVTFTRSDDAYVGDCITLPKMRGRGIYPCGLTQLAERLRSRGNGRLYLFVERENLASISSVGKAGFKPIAACSVWRVGSFVRRRWRFVRRDDTAEARGWRIEPPPAALRS